MLVKSRDVARMLVKDLANDLRADWSDGYQLRVWVVGCFMAVVVTNMMNHITFRSEPPPLISLATCNHVGMPVLSSAGQYSGCVILKREDETVIRAMLRR